MRRFPAASRCRVREGLMRSTPLLPGLITGLLLAGCGGSQQPPTSAPTPTAVGVGGPTTTAPAEGADEDEEYELDVIAGAEADESAAPRKVQLTAAVEEESGGAFTFRWDLGHGKKSSDKNRLHTH